MAVIQISRVQVRRGQTAQTGFPQLASGEFGWSIDQQELYIGNGAVSEGAPAIGNTRILTENDGNFFLLTAPSYIYKNGPDGPTVQTGPNSSPYVSRSLQDTLDDTVNLRKFGAVGDGIVNDTDALRRAILHSAINKKVLILDEGDFLVSGEIPVPPEAELRGAGMGKTRIINVSTSSILKTVGTTVGGDITDISSAANLPVHVNISGITFQSTLTNSKAMVVFNCVVDSIIEKCEFKGNPAVATTSTLADAIELLGIDALTCENLHITGCDFNNIGTAIKCDYNLNNLAVSHCDFRDIDEGIMLGKALAPGQTQGPQSIEIFRNHFQNVNNQALYVGQNLLGITTVQSSYNKYINAGIGYNNPLGDLKQATEVITFKTMGNSSQNDYFSRAQVLAANELTEFVGTIYPLVKGPWLGGTAGGTRSVSPAPGTYRLATIPRGSYISGSFNNTFQTIEINYNITRNSPYLNREGKVVISIDNTTNTATITDKFTSNVTYDGDLVFSVDLTRSDVAVVKYINNDGAGTLSFSATIRQ